MEVENKENRDETSGLFRYGVVEMVVHKFQTHCYRTEDMVREVGGQVG